MSALRQRFPGTGDVDAPRLMQELRSEPPGGPLTIHDERIVGFLGAVGLRLLAPTVARRHPALAALGYFLRRRGPAAARRSAAAGPGELPGPRGVVFHVAPANVDTLFGYSWALSALAGNANVVRLSERSPGVVGVVLDVLHDVLAEAHPAVAHTQRLVSYGHQREITDALSAGCDLRVVWGGNDAVTDVRRSPLPPLARDLTFPNRSSFAVLSAAAWSAAPAAVRQRLVERLVNDVYWFDQAACGSPRTVLWIGPADAASRARVELAAALTAATADRAEATDLATVMRRYTVGYALAADGTATRLTFPHNAITHLELPDGRVQRAWPGTGTFVWGRLDRLCDLAPLIRAEDQTLGYFGFTTAEVTRLAEACAGRGIDRFVPVGAALDFAAVWDGYDLMHQFTRITTVTGPQESGVDVHPRG